MCTQAPTYDTDVEVRGPLPGVGSFILSCGLLGSKSGHQAWQQALVHPTSFKIEVQPIHVYLETPYVPLLRR